MSFEVGVCVGAHMVVDSMVIVSVHFFVFLVISGVVVLFDLKVLGVIESFSVVFVIEVVDLVVKVVFI